MVSIATAKRLREAGLVWKPAQGDRFALPDRGLDELVFVINDMATIIEFFQGVPAVTFHGTPEWALDYVYLGEALWLPEEGQLRARLHELLAAAGAAPYELRYAEGGFACCFTWRDQAQAIAGETADEAYAAALLHVMQPWRW